MNREDKEKEEKRQGVGDEEQRSNSSLSNMSLSGFSGRQSFDSADRRCTHVNPSMTLTIKHKYSLQTEEYLSEDDQMRLEDFFDEQIIQENKVEKKDVAFRPGFFHPPFAQHLSDIIYKFTQKPNELHFSATIDAFLVPGIPIFKETSTLPQIQEGEDSYPILYALEDLFYRGKNSFLIYTFDWLICHLSFVCSLIIFWLQIQLVDEELKEEVLESPKRSSAPKQAYIRNQKRKMKQNICWATCLYAESRPQEINSNQVIVMILYHFLSLLRQDDNLNLIEICNTQNKLINDIELFRRIKRKEAEFSSTSNKVIFESQMRKYQHENKLTASLDKTYTLLHLITSHNFVSCPLLKFYQLDGFRNSRKDYQTKMEFTRMWILEIIVRNCQKKKADSLYKSANYIVTFLGILKKMRKELNLQGFSYLVPVLANIKHLMPNLWKYAVQRRSEIDSRMDDHAEFLVKKFYTREQLSGQGSAIIWGQTIFDMTDKMATKSKSTPQGTVNLADHKAFYDSFLAHLICFRSKVQKEYELNIDKYNRDREIGSSFNMYLLDSYVPKLYKGCTLDEKWRALKARAEEVDKTLTSTFSIELMDYIFVGSTTKYQRIDI